MKKKQNCNGYGHFRSGGHWAGAQSERVQSTLPALSLSLCRAHPHFCLLLPLFYQSEVDIGWFRFQICACVWVWSRERERVKMFGKVRASSCPAESLERPPSKILKDDSLSIYGIHPLTTTLTFLRSIFLPSDSNMMCCLLEAFDFQLNPTRFDLSRKRVCSGDKVFLRFVTGHRYFLPAACLIICFADIYLKPLPLRLFLVAKVISQYFILEDMCSKLVEQNFTWVCICKSTNTDCRHEFPCSLMQRLHL